MRKHLRTFVVALVTLATISAVNHVSAQENAATDSKQQAKNALSQKTSANQAQLPEMLSSLNLSDSQKQKIKQAITEHNSKLEQIWARFHTQHMKAVNLEAAWIAALESQMDDSQKQRFQESRGRDAQNRKNSSHRRDGDDGATSGGKQGDRGRENLDSDRPSEKTSRSNQDDKRAKDRLNRSEDNPARKKTAEKDRIDSKRSGQSETDDASRQPKGLLIISVVSPQRHYAQSGLSQQQLQTCDEVCRQFQQEITSTWKELHGLHMQMVAIEAAKIEAIEKSLTKEQLQQLKEHEAGRRSKNAASSDSSSSRTKEPSDN